MRANVFLAAALSLIAFSQNLFAEDCKSILTPQDQVIATLRELYNDHLITVPELVAIRNGKNPLAAKYGSREKMFSEVVDAFISELNKQPQALAQVDDLIRSIETKQDEQTVQAVKASQIFVPMTMNDIPHGTFIMGSTERDYTIAKHSVKISRDFRMSNMLVTQWQFATVMHKNPSHFQDGPEAIRVNIDGTNISMLPNNPVERLGFPDVEEFVKRVDEWSKEDNSLIYKIIPNHTRYAKIRLPTEAEWEYVARNLGQWQGNFPDGITERDVEDNFWVKGNSNRSTHPVGEMPPLYINGHPFYDMLGQVLEWTEDNYDPKFSWESRVGHETVDPVVVTKARDTRVLRGGGTWEGSSAEICYRGQALTFPVCTYVAGIRLVEVAP